VRASFSPIIASLIPRRLLPDAGGYGWLTELCSYTRATLAPPQALREDDDERTEEDEVGTTGGGTPQHTTLTSTTTTSTLQEPNDRQDAPPAEEKGRRGTAVDPSLLQLRQQRAPSPPLTIDPVLMEVGFLLLFIVIHVLLTFALFVGRYCR